ncbi:MAG: T9SS type A sorting domain-containing protein, partial [candidate division Zixibacteria bacterium]|nr:T9SS type A sorting domain-containing protein [candidate division Zixibacteria bacterium]
VDITEIGEVIEFPYNIDDGNSGWLDFGFDFTYYGTEYHRAKACTNGWLSFMDGWFVNADNLSMPDQTLPNNLLAVFWDDLNFEYSGQAYFYTNNADTAIVTWHDVADSRNEGRYTFQAVLVAPDKITYQYNDMGSARLDECTIGMENRTAEIGLQVVRNETYVANQLAVGMLLGDSNALDWLAIDADIGTVDPYANQSIPITFNTSELEEGTYSAILNLLTNDYNMLVNEIPITLNVGTVGIEDEIAELPAEFALHNVYPNPFNAEATISYSLAQASDISIEIYNLMGQRVAMPYDGFQSAGQHNLIWKAADYASGTYLVKMTNGEKSQTVRVTLLK